MAVWYSETMIMSRFTRTLQADPENFAWRKCRVVLLNSPFCFETPQL